MKMMRGALVLTAWGSLAFANPLQVQQKQPSLVQRLEKQCQANDAGACHLAATRYRLGQGVPRDPSRGEKLLMKALDLDEAGCRRGDAVSCFVAAEIHRTPPLPDERRAVPLYEKACHGGVSAACTELERLAER